MNEWENRKEDDAPHDQPVGVDSQAAPYAATADARSRYEQTEPQEPARLGPVGRLTGTLFSPGDTFKDVDRKPTILAPLLIIILSVVAAGAFFEWWVSPNWDQIFRDMIKKSLAQRGQSMPEDQIDQQVAMQVMFAKTDFTTPAGILFAIARPLFFWVFFCLIPAAIFALALMLLDAQTTFKKILSVVTWSTAAVTLVSVLVLAAALMVQDRDSLRQLNPTDQGGLLPTNIGSFMSSDTPRFVRSIAGSFDIFAIWTLILFCIGFAAISRSRRMTAGKAAVAVFGLWFIWVLVKAAASMVFPGA
jgi:hypothetical protein